MSNFKKVIFGPEKYKLGAKIQIGPSRYKLGHHHNINRASKMDIRTPKYKLGHQNTNMAIWQSNNKLGNKITKYIWAIEYNLSGKH